MLSFYFYYYYLIYLFGEGILGVGGGRVDVNVAQVSREDCWLEIWCEDGWISLTKLCTS